MEVNDVLADEVILIDVWILQKLREVDPAARQMGLEACKVPDRRIEPHIEEFPRRIGNRDAEVGRIARNVPVRKPFAIGLGAEPFASLVRDFGLQSAILRPRAQKIDARRIGQLEKEVIGRPQHWPRARQRRIRIDQIGRRIDGSAHFARIAVLILCAADGTSALDVAVRQKYRFHRIVELLDRLRVDESRALQSPVDILRQLDVLGRVRRMPVIEAQVEAFDVLRTRRGNPLDQRLRRHTVRFRLQHDRGAMRIVGTDEMHDMPLHPPEPHPDVGLDVFHDVAQVERAIGVRKRRGDKKRSGGGGRHWREKPCEAKGKSQIVAKQGAGPDAAPPLEAK